MRGRGARNDGLAQRETSQEILNASINGNQWQSMALVVNSPNDEQAQAVKGINGALKTE